MATQLKHTVKASGGDYTTLGGALAGIAADHGKDLVSLDQYCDIEIDGAWSAPIDEDLHIDTWTTSATCFIRIYTTAAARHVGVLNDAEGYYCYSNLADGSIRITATTYVRLDGLQIESDISSGIGIQGLGLSTCDIRVSNCLISTYNGMAFYDGSSGTNITMWNCLLRDTGTGSWGFRPYNTSGSTNRIFNCTIIGYDSGAVYKYGTTIVTNCLFYDNAIDVAGGVPTDTYCATNNTSAAGLTAAGTGNRFSQTFAFAGANDYHLASTDAGAMDFGVSDPGSGLFSDDIDGVARAGYWDIGMDEYVAAGTNVVLNII